MRRIIYLFLTLLCMAMPVGCSKNEQAVQTLRQFDTTWQKMLKAENVTVLEIRGDTGDIQVFRWNRPEIGIEGKKIIRGAPSQDITAETLKLLNATADQNGERVDIQFKYKGKEQKYLYHTIDMSIYVPSTVQEIKLSQKEGKFRLRDEFSGSLEAQVDAVDMDMGRVEGKVNIQNGSGHIHIAGGWLKNGSYIQAEEGWIKLLTGFDQGQDYHIGTTWGNIYLQIPQSCSASLQTQGAVEGQLPDDTEAAVRVNVSTEMGRIHIDQS